MEPPWIRLTPSCQIKQDLGILEASSTPGAFISDNITLFLNSFCGVVE